MSEAEFITAFQDVVDESTLFAPTDRLKPVGAECAFSLELADGSPMLRGLGLIVEAWSNMDSPYGRPGMKIEIDKLTPTSQVILEKLVHARAAETARKPRQRPNPSTYQLWALTPPAPQTEEMEVPDADLDEPGAEELPRTITRELRSSTPPPDHREHVESGPHIEPALEASRGGTARGLAVPVRLPRSISAPIASPAVMPPSSAFVGSSFDSSNALAASRPRRWWMNARIGGVFAAGLVLGVVISLAVGSGHGTKPTVVAAEHTSEPASRPAIATVAPEPIKAEPIKAEPIPTPSPITAGEPCTAAPTKSTAIATITEAAPTTKSTASAATTEAAPTTKSTASAATTEAAPTTKSTASAAATEAAPTTKSTAVATTTEAAPTTKSTAIAAATEAAPITKSTAVATKPAPTSSSAVASTKPSTAKLAVTSNRTPPKKKKVVVRCTSLDCL